MGCGASTTNTVIPYDPVVIEEEMVRQRVPQTEVNHLSKFMQTAIMICSIVDIEQAIHSNMNFNNYYKGLTMAQWVIWSALNNSLAHYRDLVAFFKRHNFDMNRNNRQSWCLVTIEDSKTLFTITHQEMDEYWYAFMDSMGFYEMILFAKSLLKNELKHGLYIQKGWKCIIDGRVDKALRNLDHLHETFFQDDIKHKSEHDCGNDNCQNQCMVCLSEHRSIVFFPCKHLNTCENCGTMVDECPECRQYICSIMHVYNN